MSEAYPRKRLKRDKSMVSVRKKDPDAASTAGDTRKERRPQKLTKNRPLTKSQELAIKKKSGQSPFAQSRDEMIDRYLELAMEYKNLLKEHMNLEEKRKEVEMGIASIFMQDDRLDELIDMVKEKNGTPPEKIPPRRRSSTKHLYRNVQNSK